MMNRKVALWATSALFGTLMATSAWAQSTGTQTQEVEEVVVTATRGQPTVDGVITQENLPKSRATVTQEFISTQPAGQTILQTINLTPGVNFVNSDAYGSSGGNLRIRGFDGNRISLTFDGVPLNDSGNYAIFSNQQMDPELIERASVNLGTTDVDSPTASATGGTVNYITRRTTDDFGVMVQPSVGDFNYRRLFGLVDTGAMGPYGTEAWVAGSYTRYDKFKGPGEQYKRQFNARVYQSLGDNGDFVSVMFHYNINRNYFLRNLSKPQIAFYGEDYDNLAQCTRDPASPGLVDNDNSSAAGAGAYLTANDNPANPSSCTNYAGLRINPSNTGNIRMQGRFHLADNLILTIDPSFQYVLANGGGTFTVSERDDRLDLKGPVGVDLNGDGDTLDTVRLYNPNTTNTRRYGLTSSLIWDINEQHRIRFAYTYDDAHHRQTGDFGFVNSAGDPEDVFGGKDGYGRRVLAVDGTSLRGRDRVSVAGLNQFAVEYRGLFFDDRLTVSIGVRAPVFKRELNQLCYSRDGTTTVYCTTEAPASVLANGNVTFTSQAGTYIPPYKADVEYKDILPNLGATWKLTDHQSIYVSYAEGLSAPRTDNLYTPQRQAVTNKIILPTADPETTKAWDLGWRYGNGPVIAQAALWWNKYDNRIVSSFDDVQGIFIDRNIGAVDLMGLDVQAGWEVTPTFSVYGSASWIDSELKDDVPLSATTFLPTKGKKLVETPDFTAALRFNWDATDALHLGLQGKYVGDRFSTDVNDEKADAFTVWDLDARYDLPFFGGGSYLQLNVTNLLDEDYLGNISSQNNAKTIDVDPGPGVVNRAGSAPTYSIGAPRTAMLTLRAKF